MQHSFDFTPGLTVQFPRFRDLLNAVVYSSRGSLKAVASDLDLRPSELSKMLSHEQSDPRKLDIDDLVAIISSTGDTRPVQWLIERFLHNPDQQRAMAAAQLANLLPAIAELVRQAGVVPPKARR